MATLKIKQTLEFSADINTVIFPDGFNNKLEPGSIPDNITFIDVGKTYNQEFDVGVLPKGLKKLILRGSYRQIIKPNILPNTLESLTLESYDHMIEVGVLPDNLKTLYLIKCWCEIGVGALPKSLKKLEFFKYKLKIELNVLPDTLKSLVINTHNQKIGKNVLPKSLQKLVLLRHKFSIGEDVLPESLIELELGAGFEIRRRGRLCIPKVNYSFDEIRINELPKTLKVLKISNYKMITEKNIFPESLEVLFLKDTYISNPSVLPESLKTLILEGMFETKINIKSLSTTQIDLFVHIDDMKLILDDILETKLNIKSLSTTQIDLFVHIDDVKLIDDNRSYNIYKHGRKNNWRVKLYGIFGKFDVSEPKQTKILRDEIHYVVLTPKQKIDLVEDRLIKLENKTNKIMECLTMLVEDIQ